MVTFKQLTYALAIEKTRHFKRAAGLCSVSQSALSTAIAEMESKLGLQVFERNNKQVLVTPLGAQVLEKARLIKLQLDDLNRLSESHEPLSHSLAIGVIPTISPYLLPKVLPELRRQYPGLPLTIVEEQSHVLLEQVRNGEIDTAILALPYPLQGLHAFEFWQEDFYLVTHRSEKFADYKEIASEALGDTHLLLLKEGHCLKDHALAACKTQSAEIDYSMAGASLSTLIQMTAGRMGSTLVPQMALDQLLFENSELKAVHLSDPGPHRRIAFITRLNYAGVNNITLLIKVFKQELMKHCENDNDYKTQIPT